ncbi:hypothetical protein NIES2104_10140 [Leptolyngbya sp. NIES-2104]|nr:hypothetical protein NIES2104_10140 [Leptolyngbya sp. NIES-2104]
MVNRSDQSRVSHPSGKEAFHENSANRVDSIKAELNLL